MSYYRIQDRSIDTAELLDPELQTSISYCTGTERPGKSVCGSIEELAAYFAQAGVPFDWNESVIVELTGYVPTDENGRYIEDEDAALGAYLIVPTEIISVTDLGDEFEAALDSALEELEAA